MIRIDDRTPAFPSRLGFGKGFASRDFPGCINSGMQIAILKSKTAGQLIGKPFVVGPRLHVCSVYEQIRTQPKYRRVKFYKTYKAAKKAFMTMCGPVDAAWAEYEDAKRRASRPIKTADDYADVIDAHMTLADHGAL